MFDEYFITLLLLNLTVNGFWKSVTFGEVMDKNQEFYLYVPLYFAPPCTPQAARRRKSLARGGI